MNKNDGNNFVQRLKAYSLTAGSIVGVLGTTQATIHYTDVNPDTTINFHLGFYNLDLDGGIPDFRLKQFLQVTTHSGKPRKLYSIGISILGSFDGVIATNGSNAMVVQLNYGDSIGQFQNWPNYITRGLIASYSYYSSNSINSNGNFSNTQDKYIGVKIGRGGGPHYGWVRLNVGNKAKGFTIKGFAYEDVAEKPIKAGEGGPALSVNDPKKSFPVSVYSYGRTIFLNRTKSNSIIAGINIVDMKGQVIYSDVLNGNSKKIDVQHLSSGLYIVAIKQDKAVLRRKVFIE